MQAAAKKSNQRCSFPNSRLPNANRGALEEEIATIAAIAMIAKIELHQANGTTVEGNERKRGGKLLVQW
jgi:hypothetical protein